MMVRSLALVVILVLGSTSLRAQEPAASLPPMTPAISLGELEPTPEMWFYQEEMRRYEDPKFMVREKAALAATQRRNRMASRAWFGVSNSRPAANMTPSTSRYATGWSGNGWNHFDWRGVGGGFIAVRPLGVYRY